MSVPDDSLMGMENTSDARGSVFDRTEQEIPCPGGWPQLVAWEADCILERDWNGTQPDEQELQAVLVLAGAGLLDGLGGRAPASDRPLASAA